MAEGRADDRSKKSSRREYVIRNRPRHTATDRRIAGAIQLTSIVLGAASGGTLRESRRDK